MQHTKENLIGKSIIELAWKNEKQPREFTFIFYPAIDLADAMFELVHVMKMNMAYNPKITFNCTETVPAIEIKSIFCLRNSNEDILWHFYMEPEILKKLIDIFDCSGINIVWLEDQDFGISLDKDLIITNFWIPDDGG
jgi:hypothetical protein